MMEFKIKTDIISMHVQDAGPNKLRGFRTYIEHYLYMYVKGLGTISKKFDSPFFVTEKFEGI